MLCEVCMGIFTGLGPTIVTRSARRESFLPHHRTIATLRASCWIHCHICILLRRLLPRESLKDAELIITERGTTEPITKYHLSLQAVDEEIAKYDLHFIVSIPLVEYREEKRASFELVPADLFKGIHDNSLSSNTGSPEAIQVALSWIRECTSHHNRCNSDRDDGFLPTRLLDVGLIGSTTIRLADCASEGVQGPYVTLSHCWGDAIFLKLTKSTEPILLHGFPLEDLPGTFRDAVRLCRELGVRYIWIDSLCIFQDSRSDWRTESSVMGQVYRGGLCNIAATGAHDSDQGLFFDRDGVAIGSAFIHTSWSDQSNREYLIYQKDGIWIDLNSSRLLHRAWVIQERYMAKRVLHFNKKELLWECSARSACERFPNGLYHPIMKSNLFGALRTRDFFWLEAERTARGWRRLVDIYSHCEMTKEEDKLVALSGIVREIQIQRGAQYYAGIWSTSLFGDLLWRVRQAKPTKVWRAPSWSWASLDGIINWPKQFYQDFEVVEYPSEVVDVQLTYPSSNTYGEITSGQMQLRGPLITLTVKLDNTKVNGYSDVQVFVNGRWTTVSDDSLAFDWSERPDDIEELLVTVIIIMRSAKGPGRRLSNAGLLLVPTGDEKGEYRRIGRLYTHDKKWVHSLPSNLNDVRNENWLDLDGQVDNDTNNHLITIK